MSRPSRALARTLGDRNAGFGLCPGTAQKASTGPRSPTGSTRTFRHCAGRNESDPPLTFADLRDDEDDARSVSLQLMTTDVSSGRPVRLPLPEDNDFYFDPDEIGKLIPVRVATWMRDQATSSTEVDGRTVYQVHGAGMPVLLATRMSLAVPGLIASVPFYERRSEGSQPEHVEHWFSDGAITSNFPVHFFDALLPGHPTFGLDLMGPCR